MHEIHRGPPYSPACLMRVAVETGLYAPFIDSFSLHVVNIILPHPSTFFSFILFFSFPLTRI